MIASGNFLWLIVCEDLTTGIDSLIEMRDPIHSNVHTVAKLEFRCTRS